MGSIFGQMQQDALNKGQEYVKNNPPKEEKKEKSDDIKIKFPAATLVSTLVASVAFGLVAYNVTKGNMLWTAVAAVSGAGTGYIVSHLMTKEK